MVGFASAETTATHSNVIKRIWLAEESDSRSCSVTLRDRRHRWFCSKSPRGSQTTNPVPPPVMTTPQKWRHPKITLCETDVTSQLMTMVDLLIVYLCHHAGLLDKGHKIIRWLGMRVRWCTGWGTGPVTSLNALFKSTSWLWWKQAFHLAEWGRCWSKAALFLCLCNFGD